MAADRFWKKVVAIRLARSREARFDEACAFRYCAMFSAP